MSNSSKEIALASLKLGCIDFGGIAGIISTMEQELDPQSFQFCFIDDL